MKIRIDSNLLITLLILVNMIVFNAYPSIAATVSVEWPIGGRVVSDVGGISCGGGDINICLASLPSGSTISVTAVPSPGYDFVEWRVTSLGASTSTANPHSIPISLYNVTISATFRPWLPKTGQTVCYDNTGSTSTPLSSCAGTGQDGDLRWGSAWPTPRFTNNNNGTVTDNLTGLIWLQKADCFGNQTWANALANANLLNSASNSCGLTDGSAAGDWRLPNINELRSLLDLQNNPPLPPSGHPFTGIPAQIGTYWWTSTTNAKATNNAWYISASDGSEGLSLKSNSRIAWAVKGSSAKIPKTGQTACYDTTGAVTACAGTGQDGEKALLIGGEWPFPRFINNNNGTVSDNLTGLIWLKNASCLGKLTWANALTSANGLASPNAACSLSDGSVAGAWRLPNRSELSSLTVFSAATNSTWLNDPTKSPFTSVQSSNYWTSSTFVNTASLAWGVDFGNSSSPVLYGSSKAASTTNYVWAVRGGGSSAATNLLTVSKVGSGTVTALTGINCGATCSASFAPGSVVTLTAEAATNYAFSGWSGACTGTSSTCQVSMDAAKNVTATFAVITTDGECGAAAGQPALSKPSANLCNPGMPSVVSGSGPWTWNCASTNGGNTSGLCTAPAAIKVTVTIDGNGSGSVNSNPSGVIACSYPPQAGTCSSLQTSTGPVTLTATSSGSSLFSGWGGACAACFSNSCQITMDSDKTCSATFTTLPPIRIAGSTPVYFTSLQQAFDTAIDGATIEARAVSIPENLIANGSGSLFFKGGFDGSFTTQNGYSIIQGNLTIRSTSVIADHLIISFTPVIPLAAPAQPAATPGDGRVTLSWPAVENAVSYVVYYSSTPGITTVGSTRIGSITGTSFPVTPLTNGIPWYFRVAAVNSGGEGPLSPEQSATPFVQPPLAPSGLKVTSGDSQVIIQWDPVPGATSYSLYISDTPGVNKTTGLQFVDVPNPCAVTLLTNDVQYYFVVTAVNSNGEGVESNEASGIPYAAIAPDMSLVPVSMTFDERTAALNIVKAFRAANKSGDLDVDNANLANYIKTLADFADAGVSDDHTVWARFKDGRPVVWSSVQFGNSGGAANSNLMGAAGEIVARTEEIPPGGKAVLIDMGGTGMGGPAAVQPWLNNPTAGYSSSIVMNGHINELMTEIKDAAVLYFSTHGLFGACQAGRHTYSLVTADKRNVSQESMYNAGFLTIAEDGAGDTYWAISEEFVKTYWSFNPGSLIVIDGCSLFDRRTVERARVGGSFLSTLANASGGKTTVAGWDSTVYNIFAAKTIKQFFDLVLGANSIDATVPPQRPYTFREVYDWMVRTGKDVDNTTPNSDAKFRLESSVTGGKLVPIINSAIVGNPAPNAQYGGMWILELVGSFGPEVKGVGAGTVTVGTTQLPVLSWSEGAITAKLPAPMGSPGTYGDIMVEVRGHRSNTVPLTQWTGTVTQIQTGKIAGGGKVELSCPVRATSDVHFFRIAPHEIPQIAGGMKIEVPSACSYTLSGSWTVGSYGYVLSGSGTYSPLPVIPGAADIFGTLYKLNYVSAFPVDYFSNFYPTLNTVVSGMLTKTDLSSNTVTKPSVSVQWSLAPPLSSNIVTLKDDYTLTGTLDCKSFSDPSSYTCNEKWTAAPIASTVPKPGTMR